LVGFILLAVCAVINSGEAERGKAWRLVMADTQMFGELIFDAWDRGATAENFPVQACEEPQFKTKLIVRSRV
jgi:hypothetical protein